MTKGEKTLIILTPGFAKDEADSTCIPTQQNFVRCLNEICPGINIIILALDYPYTKKTYQWFNNSVISFDGRNKGGLSKLLLRQKVFSTLKKINSTSNIIGLLSFWWGESALIAKKFAGRNGLKHICWVWGQDARKNNDYARRIRPRNDELAVLSDFLQDEFEKNHGIRPLHVIPPGINIDQFNKKIVQKDIDIVAAGSLIQLKQYDVFINIVAQIKQKIPAVKAILIGNGPEKNKLEALIDKHGLQSNIIMAGELQHSEVLKEMQRAKVFLHPSSYEGFGIVCLEALYSGVHVISFVKPIHKEIENWHIVKTENEMLQNAIQLLRNNDTEYKSVTPFTIEETTQKMAKLFSL